MSVFHLVVLSLFAWQVELKEMALVVVVALCFEAYINSFLTGYLFSILSPYQLLSFRNFTSLLSVV